MGVMRRSRPMNQLAALILLAIMVLMALPEAGRTSPSSSPTYTLSGAPHAPIVIVGDANFTPANGVVSGSGTLSDPYIIEGWTIEASVAAAIDIHDTRAHFVVRNINVFRSNASYPFYPATAFANVSNARTEYVNAMAGVGGFGVLNSEGVEFAHLNATGFGVHAAGGSNLTISSSHFTGPYAYVWVVHSNAVRIESNLVEGGTIRINNTRDVVISQNILNPGSILLSGGRMNNTIISENVVEGALEGIAATGAANLTIEGNYVTSTQGALRLDSSADVWVAANSFTDNAKALTIRWFSRNVSFFHNNFAGNPLQAMFDQTDPVRWNESYPLGGNFWSDYSGVDNCSGPNQDVCPEPDGIGDTPYVINANNSDRYPFIHSFANDTTAPSVSIVDPVEGTIFHASRISVSGVASDAGGSGLLRVEVRVNSLPWVPADGRSIWNASIDLEVGGNTILARSWDNAGNPSPSAEVNLTYEAPPPPPNAPPYVNFTWSPFPADTETLVNFTAIVFDDHDPERGIQVRWDWESDGTWDTAWSLEKVAQHRFPVAGTYNVTLEAKDTDGLTASRTFTVPISEPPPPPPPPLSVHIVTSPSAGTMPLTVSFTSDVSGGVPPYAYQWTLGDGSTSPAANTVHIYLTGGNFTVWLIASDTAHQSEVSNVLWVNVTPAAVNLTVERPTDFVQTSDGTNVTFHASVWGGVPPYSYRWEFGDGGTSNDLQPTHTYSAPGNYTIRVRVRDSEGRVAGYTMVFSVPATRSPAATTPPPSSIELAWVAIGTICGVGAGLALGVLLARRFRIPKGRREN